MNSVLELHRRAMEFADTAIVARHGGDLARAAAFYRQAFELERDAAQLVPHASEPTRSVLYRSAASMAFNCGELDEAKRLISIGLSGKPPAEIAEELKDLRQQVASHLAPASYAHVATADDSGWTTEIDSKYRLVLLAAKRSKQIQRGARPRVHSLAQKATRIALEEIEQHKVPYQRVANASMVEEVQERPESAARIRKVT